MLPSRAHSQPPRPSRTERAEEAKDNYRLYTGMHRIFSDAWAGRTEAADRELRVMSGWLGVIAGSTRSAAVDARSATPPNAGPHVGSSRPAPRFAKVFFEAATEATRGIMMAQHQTTGDPISPSLLEWLEARGEPDSIPDLCRRLGPAVTERDLQGLRALNATALDRSAVAPRWSDEARGYRAVAVVTQAAIDANDFSEQDSEQLARTLRPPRSSGSPGRASTGHESPQTPGKPRTGAAHPLRETLRNFLPGRGKK